MQTAKLTTATYTQCFTRFRDCIGSHISGCCYHGWSHNSAVSQTEVLEFYRFSKVSIYVCTIIVEICNSSLLSILYLLSFPLPYPLLFLLPRKAQIPLAAIPEADTTAIADTQQLYEEIRPSPVAPAPGTPAAPMHHVEYEDVKPAVGVAESGGTYHVTLCSAYGVPLERI